ncbi:uncharacterized protein BJ171DRAFT_517989, partial [Polychytrium aggregatum]|uniref:uncharacterized protein n=1 Tax=Polychytrium aggregatum TaxID=110093 RepID=UPI0022FE3D2A
MGCWLPGYIAVGLSPARPCSTPSQPLAWPATMSAVPTLNPANVQWLLYHENNTFTPDCVPQNIGDAQFGQSLSDALVATNRCYCFSNPPSCTFYSLSGDTVNRVQCDLDGVCASNCKVTNSTATSAFDHCASGITGLFTSQDYTASPFWNSSFQTTYKMYFIYAANDPSCQTPREVMRYPIYPSCTKVADRYMISIRPSGTDSVEQYVCRDPQCTSCHYFTYYTLSNTTSSPTAIGGTNMTVYGKGFTLSDSSLTLYSKFPNGSDPLPLPTLPISPISPISPTSSPSQTDSGSSSLIAGIVGGIAGVLVAATIGVVVWLRWRSKQAKSPSGLLPPPPETYTYDAAPGLAPALVLTPPAPVARDLPSKLAADETRYTPESPIYPAAAPAYPPALSDRTPSGSDHTPHTGTDIPSYQTHYSQQASPLPSKSNYFGFASSTSHIPMQTLSSSTGSAPSTPHISDPGQVHQLPGPGSSRQDLVTPLPDDSKDTLAMYRARDPVSGELYPTEPPEYDSLTVSGGYPSPIHMRQRYVAIRSHVANSPLQLSYNSGDVVLLLRPFQDGYT